MKHSKTILFSLISLAILAFVTQVSAQVEDATLDLKQKVKGVEFKDISLEKAATSIALEFQIPVGVESDHALSSRTADLVTNDGSIESLFDAIGTTFDAKWTVENGVVVIRRVAETNSVLDTVTKSFKTRESTELRLKSTIVEIPEFVRALRKAGINPFILSIGTINGKLARDDFIVDVKNRSIRNILGVIAKKTLDHYWVVVYRTDERGRTMSINF